MITKTVTNYKNYGKVLLIDNGIAELAVTIDCGPRVISYKLKNGVNIMLNDDERKIKECGEAFDNYYFKGAAWYIYGGHRLWTSPESIPENYYPEQDAVDYKLIDKGAIFTPKPQTENGVAMEIEIAMEENSTKVKVDHRITNISGAPKEFALWALSVLAAGGLEVIEQNDKDTGLLHNRQMSLWAYTKMNDKRVYFGDKFITLKQDINADCAFKIGLDLHKGRAFYALEDTVFIKTYHHIEGGRYPDNGMSFETFTNSSFIEMETLGELKNVAVGETVSHSENWELKKNPGTPGARDEAALSRFVSGVLNG